MDRAVAGALPFTVNVEEEVTWYARLSVKCSGFED